MIETVDVISCAVNLVFRYGSRLEEAQKLI